MRSRAPQARAPERPPRTATPASPVPGKRLPWRQAALGCLGGAAVVGGALTLAPGIWSLLGWLLLLPVTMLLLLWGAAWLWRRIVWKARRRLFVSFLFIGVAPLLMSMALTGVVEIFYWLFLSASVVSMSLDDVGSDLAVLADAAADAARRRPAADLGAPEELVPARERFPGLQVHLLGADAADDPLTAGAPLPSWLGNDTAMDGMFLVEKDDSEEMYLAWASVREIAGSGKRLLLVLPLQEELAETLQARTGVSLFTPTAFIPEGTDPDPNIHIGERSPGREDGTSINVQGDTEEELGRAWNRVPPGFRYPWAVTHAVSRWSDAQPGTCFLIFISSLKIDLERLEKTYSGVLGKVLVRLLPGLLAVFFVFYLGCLGVGVLIAGHISGGIGRLYQAAQEYARGNLDYRIRLRSRDQLGELAASLNAMAGNIQRLLSESAERERLAQEILLAQEVQRKLLPAPIPPVAGAEVAGSLRPMTEVGGDTYDWRTLSDHELMVMVADVSGHGLRPGLLAAMAKACLVTKLGHTTAHPPIMEALHQLTLGALDRRLFMTVSLATFDMKRRTLQVSSAGHPPCLRFRDGAVTEILEESFPLGIRRERSFVPRDLDLQEDDVYLFISDGLVEGRDASGAVWGYDRLAASLLEHGGGSAQAIVDALLAEHDRFCGETPQTDDITLVVVRIGGEDAPGGSAGPAAAGTAVAGSAAVVPPVPPSR